MSGVREKRQRATTERVASGAAKLGGRGAGTAAEWCGGSKEARRLSRGGSGAGGERCRGRGAAKWRPIGAAERWQRWRWWQRWQQWQQCAARARGGARAWKGSGAVTEVVARAAVARARAKAMRWLGRWRARGSGEGGDWALGADPPRPQPSALKRAIGPRSSENDGKRTHATGFGSRVHT